MGGALRVGIIGTGLITQSTHLPWALATPGIEVAALVDPVVARAQALASAYGISPRIASDVTQVLGHIEAALIATPNHAHRVIALACIEQEIPVLIEKPLATTYAEGAEIVEAAERRAVPVAVGYSTRFRENVMLLKELLDQDYFGPVRRFVHQFGTRGGWAPLSSYNLTKETSGGGVLVVTGSHFLDRMLHFWGYPDQCEFEDDSQGGPEANCRAYFRYVNGDGGFEGMAMYSKTVALPGRLLIETDEGLVQLPDTDAGEIQFRRHGMPGLTQIIRRTPPPAAREVPSSYQRQYEDFIRAVRGDGHPAVSGRQGLESLRLFEDLYAVRRPMRAGWYSAEVA